MLGDIKTKRQISGISHQTPISDKIRQFISKINLRSELDSLIILVIKNEERNMQIGIHCMPFTNLKHSSLFNNFINYSNSYFESFHALFGPCKVRNETETQTSEPKRNTTKRNRNANQRTEAKHNETKRNTTKRSKFCKLRNET